MYTLSGTKALKQKYKRFNTLNKKYIHFIIFIKFLPKSIHIRYCFSRILNPLTRDFSDQCVNFQGNKIKRAKLLKG